MLSHLGSSACTRCYHISGHQPVLGVITSRGHQPVLGVITSRGHQPVHGVITSRVINLYYRCYQIVRFRVRQNLHGIYSPSFSRPNKLDVVFVHSGYGQWNVALKLNLCTILVSCSSNIYPFACTQTNCPGRKISLKFTV